MKPYFDTSHLAGLLLLVIVLIDRQLLRQWREVRKYRATAPDSLKPGIDSKP